MRDRYRDRYKGVGFTRGTLRLLSLLVILLAGGEAFPCDPVSHSAKASTTGANSSQQSDEDCGWADAMARAAEFDARADGTSNILLQDTPPPPVLVSACRECPFFDSKCLGVGKLIPSWKFQDCLTTN